jgi:DNA-binding MarR family transcriptional regulator
MPALMSAKPTFFLIRVNVPKPTPGEVQLTNLLRLAAAHVAAVVADHLSTERIDARAYHALTVLADGTMNQRQLADRLALNKDVMVQVAYELERANLIERLKTDRDRRQYILRITPSGRDALRRAAKMVQSAYEQLKAEFSDQEWKRGMDFLRRIATVKE